MGGKLYIPADYNPSDSHKLSTQDRNLIVSLQNQLQKIWNVSDDDYVPPALILYRLECAPETVESLTNVLNTMEVQPSTEDTHQQLQTLSR